MRHNLRELRAATLQWLDDPHGDSFATNGNYTRLDQLINEAYASAINQLDTIPQPWNLSLEADAVSVSTVAGTREYSLGRARNVVEVVENLTDGTDTVPLPIVPYWKRNTAGEGLYLFRNHTSGNWYVGLVIYLTPQYTTLRAFLREELDRLVSDGDEPVQLPSQWHELIFYKAAMLGKMQENREAQVLGALYAEKLQEMQSAKPPGNPMRVRALRD